MATIRSAFVDHSLLDDTGDYINGSEVDANPYLLADILDGTTATQLNQTGSLAIINFEAIDISTAAGGIRTALRVRHDPVSGTVTAGDGPRILFEADDSAGNKTTIGEIRAPWVTVTDGGTEASNIEILARVANASVEMLSLGTDGLIWNETGLAKNARFEGDADANLLFLDGTNDRVGIGTASPAVKLDVSGAVNLTGTYALPLRLGDKRIWFDVTNNVIRTKNSAPSSETDGYFLQELT